MCAFVYNILDCGDFSTLLYRTVRQDFFKFYMGWVAKQGAFEDTVRSVCQLDFIEILFYVCTCIQFGKREERNTQKKETISGQIQSYRRLHK